MNETYYMRRVIMPKLLVVDDDPDMLDLVRAALERDGHQVDTATY